MAQQAKNRNGCTCCGPYGPYGVGGCTCPVTPDPLTVSMASAAAPVPTLVGWRFSPCFCSPDLAGGYTFGPAPGAFAAAGVSPGHSMSWWATRRTIAFNRIFNNPAIINPINSLPTPECSPIFRPDGFPRIYCDANGYFLEFLSVTPTTDLETGTVYPPGVTFYSYFYQVGSGHAESTCVPFLLTQGSGGCFAVS
jgi:hypothetical protein